MPFIMPETGSFLCSHWPSNNNDGKYGWKLRIRDFHQRLLFVALCFNLLFPHPPSFYERSLPMSNSRAKCSDFSRVINKHAAGPRQSRDLCPPPRTTNQSYRNAWGNEQLGTGNSARFTTIISRISCLVGITTCAEREGCWSSKWR